MKGTVFARIIDIILTLVVCLSIAFALLWFVHTFNVFKLPAVLSGIFSSENKSIQTQDEFESNLLALLDTEQYQEDEYTYISLSSDKALQLLSSFVPTEDFFWEVKTTFTYSSQKREQLHKIYKRGSSVRIDTTEDSIDLTTVLTDGMSITVNNETGEIMSFSGDTDFNYTNLINIAALEYALKSDSDSVSDIAIVDAADGKFLYAELKKDGVNGIDGYFVSLDYGLVLSAFSTLDGIQYFTQETLSFDNTSVISDDAFVIDLKKEEPQVHQ